MLCELTFFVLLIVTFNNCTGSASRMGQRDARVRGIRTHTRYRLHPLAAYVRSRTLALPARTQAYDSLLPRVEEKINSR